MITQKHRDKMGYYKKNAGIFLNLISLNKIKEVSYVVPVLMEDSSFFNPNIFISCCKSQEMMDLVGPIWSDERLIPFLEEWGESHIYFHTYMTTGRMKRKMNQIFGEDK